jgi:hypothetical protein
LADNINSLPRSRVAVDRLEKAVSRLEALMGSSTADLFGNAELKATRDDYTRLEEASRVVESRLDAVIGRLKTILEE